MLSEIGFGWKYNDQMGFTFVSLKFKENSRTVTTIEFNGGLFLQDYYYRMAREEDNELFLLLLNGWRISLINCFYYLMAGE